MTWSYFHLYIILDIFSRYVGKIGENRDRPLISVNFPLGHQAGKPFDPEGQTRILLDALHVLETATTSGTLIQLPYKWDERDPLDSWEEEEMLHPSLV